MRDTTRRTMLKLMGGTAAATTAVGSASAQETGDESVFVASLSSDDVVGQEVDTEGAGFAVLTLDEADSRLDYLLVTARTENVTQAHIHVGAADENGPVVAYLYGFVEGGVTRNGILSSGSIVADDLVGPLEGEPLDVLTEEMTNGNTYVQVHTTQNPPGETRGQIG